MESTIKIVRETEFYQGYIRFKMAVTNESPYAIMDVTLDFIYDDDLLHIDRHEPASLSAKQGKYILGNIDGGKSKSISVYFDPLMCTKGTDIGCQVIYKDYHGDLKLDQMEPKEINVVCPIIKTDSDINIGKLKQFIEELPHKDERIYEIQSGFNIQKIEKLAREVVEKRDVRHIRTLYSSDRKKCEMWYYGKTKVTTDNIVIRVSIQTADQTVELFAATQAAEALTGLLAEIGRNIKDAIESQVSGKGRVVNIAIDKSKITGNNLIDQCNDDVCYGTIIKDDAGHNSGYVSDNERNTQIKQSFQASDKKSINVTKKEPNESATEYFRKWESNFPKKQPSSITKKEEFKPLVNYSPSDYAGVWTRLIAAFIDGLILLIPLVILLIIFSDSIWLYYIFQISICVLYFSILESSIHQATFGKRLVGVKVIDLNGNRISFGKAIVRYFAKLITGSILVGYIPIIYSEKKQGMYDTAVGTLVVHSRPED